jgi:adenylate kinase family enzyme
MKLKLMILGPARHGKDTVAEILSEAYGLKFISSSFAAAEKVMVPYFSSIGIKYANLDECYADRVNHRQEWYEEIIRYNTPDHARLAREIYSVAEIYVGIRSAKELDAIRAEHLFDYSIWVDRSKHVPPEPSTSISVTKEMANYVIDNNGTLEQLKVNARSLYIDLVSLEYAAKGHN